MRNRKYMITYALAAFAGLVLAGCGAPEEFETEMVDEGETSAAISGGRLMALRPAGATIELASISPTVALVGTLTPLPPGLAWADVDVFRSVYSNLNGRFYQIFHNPLRIATINPFNDTTTVVPLQRLVDIEMNNQGQLIGTCAAPGTTSTMEICRVDPATGVVTTLTALGVTSAWNAGPVSAFRSATNRYYALMRLDDGAYHLFTVNASTGAIISDATVTDQPGFVLHHGIRVNSSGQLITVRRNNANLANIVSINPTNGVVTSLNASPGIGLNTWVPMHNAIASQWNQLFQIGSAGGSQRLFTINATTGAVTTQPVMLGEFKSLHHFGPQ